MDHGIVCCCSVARSWELKIATRNYSIDITDEHRLSAEVRECSPVCFSCLLWRNWFVDEVFFVRIESSNRIGRCNQTTVVYTLHLQPIFNPSVFCICVERDWSTDYGTRNWVGLLVYFNSVIKRVKQCCFTLILLPKSTLNANLTTTNRFFTYDDWQRGRFENFESDHQYQSNRESDVRFEIESNQEASQVPR